MDDVRLNIYAKSITVREHKQLRDAVDAASVCDEITWLQNSAGARIAAIVPPGLIEFATQHGWGRIPGHPGRGGNLT